MVHLSLLQIFLLTIPKLGTPTRMQDDLISMPLSKHSHLNGLEKLL